MALRSLNCVGPERQKAMRKSRLASSHPCTNDENVDVLAASAAPRLPRCNGTAAVATLPAAAVASDSSSSGNATNSNTIINNNNNNSCNVNIINNCINNNVASSSISSSSKIPLSESVVSPAVPHSEDASAEIEYILSENLPDLDDVDLHLATLLERLDSKDWLKVCEAINNMRQLTIYHADDLRVHLEKIVPLIVKAMKNPRSALCKTAIMASADLFKAYPETILNMLEQLLLQLLLKASQDKKFVCEEAERSLETMTGSLSPAPLLQQLQPYVKHRSPKVRAKAASCVYRLVLKLGSEGIRGYGFEPLLQMAGSQLNDQLPESRESARKLIAEVYAAYPCVIPTGNSSEESTQEQQDWNQFCSSQLSSNVAQAIIRLTSGA